MPTIGRVTWLDGTGWKVEPASGRTALRGGREEDPFVAALRDAGLLEATAAGSLALEADLFAGPTLHRGAEPPANLGFELAAEAGESFVVLARQPSGALVVCSPQLVERNSLRGSASPTGINYRFEVGLGRSDDLGPGTRRGLGGRLLRLLVWKVLDQLTENRLEALARSWETRLWQRSGRTLGWVRVTPEGLRRDRLEPSTASSSFGERNLLLLHGTFSSAEGAFKGLAETRGGDGQDFFHAIEAVYQGRVFAFNHFTVSESPEANARALLAALPEGPTRFDVITHSRGGLVLRQITERSQDLEGLAARFSLGRVVLVAAPNEGTPIASPRRMQETVGWLANFIDLFPESGLTFGLSFVAEGLAWIARRTAGELVGLAAMNPDGESIRLLQAASSYVGKPYSALVANFEPTGSLAARLLDAGLEAFFDSANDLVVPTEGGWRVDRPPGISSRSIGCFGPGGNLLSTTPVHHTRFFDESETVNFLVRVLFDQDHPLPPLGPDLELRRRELTRASHAYSEAAPGVAEPTPRLRSMPILEHTPRPARAMPTSAVTDALHLRILDPRTRQRKEDDERAKRSLETAKILATYRNSQVLEDFHLKGAEAGKRFAKILERQKQIRNYVDGWKSASKLPEPEELRELGEWLFACLFPGETRRLYDQMSNTRDGRRLDILLTSMIPWIADLPWEFAFDPVRGTFLATEDINFVRNVVTAVPAEEIVEHPAALRILVVAAQPVGWGPISLAEEIELVSRGFRPLEEQGLVEFEVLCRITPTELHQTLHLSQLRGRRFDVLHFIGHGEFDKQRKTGCLIFEDGRGASARVDTDSLRQIACRRGIRILFLNACETGTGEPVDFNNRGVAQGLVAGGVPVVVGNQYKVLDRSATVFAQHFYWALAQGASVGDAAREARVAVSYSISGEMIDWAVPVVFAQNPRESICQPRSLAAASRSEVVGSWPQAPAVQRRSREAARDRIGLWDVNGALPGLLGVVERLNRAQASFEFEAVHLIAPIGTWRLERGEHLPERAYVDADQVNQRLGMKPEELGLRKLLCFTTFWLKDQEWLNLYSWDELPYPNDRLAIFSLAGFEAAFNDSGLMFERAIANLVGGALLPIEEHEDGARNCPCYFNPRREVQLVAGALELCPECVKRLTDNGFPPLQLEAVRAILDAYPATKT